MPFEFAKDVAVSFERDNGNVHRAAAKIIVSKSRATRGSVCNVLLSSKCQRESPGLSLLWPIVMQVLYLPIIVTVHLKSVFYSCIGHSF